MEKRKIDKLKLAECLKQGKSQAECARFFNVSESAISQAVKRFNIAVAKKVAGEKEASELVHKKKTAMNKLMNLVSK